MQLDSVRQLKQSLNAMLLASFEKPAVRSAAIGVPAQPTATAGTLPTIALGLARRTKQQYRLAVRVQDRSLEAGPQLDLIRREACGEIDVRYVGPILKRAVPWYQRRCRPLRIGASVGHFKVTAGTLGCFVRRRGEKTPLILSNNHVLANENRAKRGDDILQPGSFDQGQPPEDVMGQLAEFVRLKRVGTNYLDCALATMDDGIKHSAKQIKGVGAVTGLGDLLLDEGVLVHKLGRTTGLTGGRVTAFELDNLVVGFDIGNLRFDNQIEIEGADDGPFSQGGDSGSLIVDEERRAVALLFAGGDQGGTNGKGLTYANPIQAALDALKVELVY